MLLTFNGGVGSSLGATIDTLAQTIQTQEGWFPGSVSYRDNNPGNLMYVGQYGATGADASGFAVFPSYSAGYQALVNQINLDANRGYTLLQFSTKYLGGDPNNPGVAPGGDPVAYAQALASSMGVDPNTTVASALDSSGGATVDASGNYVMDLSGGSGGTDWATIGLLVAGALVVTMVMN